jgi:hypothetical protein
LKKKSSNDIIGGTNGTLSFAVLLRCMGTRESKEDAVGGAKSVEFSVAKFTAIVTLNREYVEVELGLSIGVEG